VVNGTGTLDRIHNCNIGGVMQKPINTLAILLLFSVSTAVQADTETGAKTAPDRNYNLNEENRFDDEAAKPYILNVKNYNLTPAAFQKIAIKAFLKYRWKIEANEVTRVQGSYIKIGKTYKTEIRYTGDNIIIEYVPGAQSANRNWLRSLANYVQTEVRAYQREMEAQRYLKQ